MLAHKDLLVLSCRHFKPETLPPSARVTPGVSPPTLPVWMVHVPALPLGRGSDDILWEPFGADFSNCGSRSQFLLLVIPFLGLGFYTWEGQQALCKFYWGNGEDVCCGTGALTCLFVFSSPDHFLLFEQKVHQRCSYAW